MVTAASRVSIDANSEAVQKRIFVDIPQSDMVFFNLFANKMGWQINNRQRLWDEYIKNSPKNVALSEEEIAEEVRAVRYGKAQGNC